MKELRTQLVNALLVILTAAACIAAFFNFQQNFHPSKRFRLPDDGVTWVDRKAPDRVQAIHVASDSPGHNAGLRAGDIVRRIQGVTIRDATDVVQVLLNVKPYLTAEYTVVRKGVEFPVKLIVGERVPDGTVSYQYLNGLAWLGVGLFVYFRRGSAPKALQFLLLSLVHFVLSTFHYTGKLNNFDKVIYWGNVAAGIFAPTVFLHFCLTFPQPRSILQGRGRTALIYVPGMLLLAMTVAIAAGNLRVDISPPELRWMLDRLLLAFYCATYLIGAVALHVEFRRIGDAIVRQQLKWLRNGTLVGIVPFALLYAVPYVAGAAPVPAMRWAVLFMPFIPLTWAYAIVRYRLMDVDIIFQQGYVYTLATLGVLATIITLFFTVGRVQDLEPPAVIGLLLLATFVFQPIRNWMQEILDRHWFYRGRYQARSTIMQFARELSAEPDLSRMLDSVADRLTHSLNVRRSAVFLRADDSERFELWKLWPAGEAAPDLMDLRFLSTDPGRPYLFFERTYMPLDVVTREYPVSVRHTIASLDLTYYVPCVVRGKTIAYLALSRREDGDFLSSDDLELLVTLSGYVGIAIENSRLYSSLQEKADEYERLKEFSENIVESINVGILAADLDDRVDSWNSQIEKLTGVSRDEAVGRPLSDLFPEELCRHLDAIRGAHGVHDIYKFVWKRDDGREMVLNIAVAPLISKAGNEIGRLIIFDDVTDRAELERRLLQADKLSSLGLLAAGVAHEVNTPLAVISTYAQMLTKQLSEDESKSKLLEKIARQTFRASEIVNSLLNFSRNSPGEFSEVDLNRTLEETVGLVRHQLDKAQVRVEIDLDPDLPTIKGNSGKLQQVFLNLVINARDAMESGGHLRVRSSLEGSAVAIEISDTGGGIPPEVLPRIYDPFFTTKGARKGTGLGLSVTYGIVQEHGGSIEVQSQVGRGTTFQLLFPLARKNVAA